MAYAVIYIRGQYTIRLETTALYIVTVMLTTWFCVVPKGYLYTLPDNKQAYTVVWTVCFDLYVQMRCLKADIYNNIVEAHHYVVEHEMGAFWAIHI